MARQVFKLPDLGEGIVEAEIVQWHISAGDTVAEDQPLVEMMTDKAVVEIPSPINGTIVSIHGNPGDIVTVGTELIVFDRDGAEAGDAEASLAPEPPAVPKTEPETAPKTQTAAPARPPTSPAPLPAPARPIPAAAPSNRRPLASPAVRRRAKDAGVDLVHVAGSGPAGRISHDDLDAFMAGGGQPTRTLKAPRTDTTEVPVIGLRRKIAERMALSKRSIPHFSYVEEVDVTELEDLRGHLNGNRTADQPKLTVLPFLIQALVRVLGDFPQCNATYDDERGVVTRYGGLHFGVATQTDSGLKVPIIRHAETLDLWQSATELGRVSAAAKNNTASRDELSGSTITITSMGRLGGIASTPVINYPEVAIIGVNRLVERVAVRDGRFVARKMMNLSSSFDHRVVDGYDAAAMIQSVKNLLEHPATIFI